MSVGSWDPSAAAALNAEDIERLVVAAGQLEEATFGLDAVEIARLAPLARHDGNIDWRSAAGTLSDSAIETLIRLFTLAEQRFPSWESGPRSPVVPLVAELKARGAYPPDLTRWIKAHTANRFLPHGSLLDRL